MRCIDQSQNLLLIAVLGIAHLCRRCFVSRHGRPFQGHAVVRGCRWEQRRNVPRQQIGEQRQRTVKAAKTFFVFESEYRPTQLIEMHGEERADLIKVEVFELCVGVDVVAGVSVRVTSACKVPCSSLCSCLCLCREGRSAFSGQPS